MYITNIGYKWYCTVTWLQPTAYISEQGKGAAIWADEHHWKVHCVRSSEWSTFPLHYVYRSNVIDTDNIYTQKVISSICFAIFISLLGSPMTLLTAGTLTSLPDPQLPARQLRTCARMVHGWASTGCPLQTKIIATPERTWFSLLPVSLLLGAGLNDWLFQKRWTFVSLPSVLSAVCIAQNWYLAHSLPIE